jgi:hypothetical protein
VGERRQVIEGLVGGMLRSTLKLRAGLGIEIEHHVT